MKVVRLLGGIDKEYRGLAISSKTRMVIDNII